MNNSGDKWLVILAVVLIAAAIIGPILIWQSDLPVWLKWLLTK